MSQESSSPTRFRDLIDRIRRNQQSTADLIELKGVARAMALVSLKRKESYGGIHPDFLKQPLADLASTCINDLFGTSERLVPAELKTMLVALDLAAAADPEILIFLRRLVFARVNTVVYRAYAEADAALGEIIRGLELCAGPLGIFQESERFGIPMLSPAGSELSYHRPIYALNELVLLLGQLSPQNGKFHGAMTRLAAHLHRQADHACAVPLVALALACRQYLTIPEDTSHDHAS